MKNNAKNGNMGVLYNKEERIVLVLRNLKYQAQLYLNEWEKLSSKYSFVQFQDRADRFKSVLEYYRDELIPILQESAELEEKHIAVLGRNPDPFFEPIKLKVEHHQRLTTDFIKRFEQIHKEFQDFSRTVKNQYKSSA